MKAGRTNYQLVAKFNGLQLRIISLYISNHDSQFYVREMANKTPDFCLNVEKVLEALSEGDIEKIRLKFGVRDA